MILCVWLCDFVCVWLCDCVCVLLCDFVCVTVKYLKKAKTAVLRICMKCTWDIEENER